MADLGAQLQNAQLSGKVQFLFSANPMLIGLGHDFALIPNGAATFLLHHVQRGHLGGGLDNDGRAYNIWNGGGPVPPGNMWNGNKSLRVIHQTHSEGEDQEAFWFVHAGPNQVKIRTAWSGYLHFPPGGGILSVNGAESNAAIFTVRSV